MARRPPTVYRVVGCRDCGALWIVADRPETTRCPRCGRRHRFERLHAFAEAAEEDAARQARARLLAERSGHGEAFADLDDAATMAGRLDAAGVPDVEYLEGSGLDADAVAEAGERATSGPARAPSRREAVLDALRELDRPEEAEVVEHAADRGVPAEAASDLLARLVRAGEVSESGGRYRLL